MDIQVIQIITVLIWGALAFVFWKVKAVKGRVAIGLIAALLFLFNPVKFTTGSIASIERLSGKDFAVPPKTIVDSKSFEDKQKQEMESLKNQSEDMKHEVHN